jgi:pilus assembly protein Flp/PilA
LTYYHGQQLIQGAIIMIYQPREEGQGLVEYALILVLVAVVVIVILALVGPAVGNIFSNIVNAL